MRFFRWVWEKIKQLFSTMTTRTFLFLGFVFTWLVPIYLLNEQIALTETVNLGWKLSFVGVLVSVFVALKFYGKLRDKINSIDPKTRTQLFWQFVLIVLHKSITFGIVAVALNYLTLFFSRANQWYFASLIPIGIGLFCYLIDRYIVFKKKRAKARQQLERLKEEIREDLQGGE